MLNVSTGAKKKRVSKKKKISWRKHINTNDVDAFLEDQRLEERLGKPLALVPNDELFKLDTAPSNKDNLTRKEKKLLRLKQPPKCFSLLKPFTNVPDPISVRNRVRTKEERKNDILKKKEVGKRANGIFKQKDLQSVKDRLLETEKRVNKPTKHDFDKDIWETEASALVETSQIDISVMSDQWITGDAERHILHGTGKCSKGKPNSHRQKSSILEPVEPPHPGTSYNPSYEDHQDLLRQIVDKEQKVIKDENHINRVTRDMFRKITVHEKDSSWLTEMSEGLPKPGDISEEIVDSIEYKSVNPPTKNKMKTLKQRRVQKEQKQLEQVRRKAKEEKKKISDMYKLKFINKDIEKAQKKAKMLHDKRLKIEEYKKREARRLGNVKFEEPDADFNMRKEITGNLRTMRKAGNLLNDRFKSLQKRNIIEPTLIRNKKKSKIKRFQRAGFKDDFKTTIAKPNKK